MQYINPGYSTTDIAVFGDPIQNAVEQAIMVANNRAVRVALMADHHQGYSMPIGGVAAYDGFLSPTGVGFDIGCGNKAVRLSVSAKHVRFNIVKIMDEIASKISFGMGRNNESKVDDKYMGWADTSRDVWNIPYVKGLRDLAVNQIGTVGGGNHYVDVFIDNNEQVWVGVHFGSRGFGHKIATHYVNLGGGEDGIMSPPVLLHYNSDLGAQYRLAMEAAGEYAYAGRDWVCDTVAGIIGGEIVEEVHNHHNFTWEEEHVIDGKRMNLFVVRKGATPAWPGQKGFIGGSMGDFSYIVQGQDGETFYDIIGDQLVDIQKASLFSTVHGAGRIMSRTEAKGKVKNGRVVKEPALSREAWGEHMNQWGVELRGGDLDEAPGAYKRIEEVLDAQGSTIRILNRLKPVGVAMAPSGVVDPYKD